MSLASPPEFREMNANAPQYRNAFAKAGVILEDVDTSFSVYPSHYHESVVVTDGRVLFEKAVIVDDKPMLRVFPMSEAEARELGKPSVWVFEPGENGETKIHVLRYAENVLFEDAGVDPDSAGFLTDLQRVADDFVAEGVYELLELNIADYLFPPPPGMLTRERTFSGGYHLVDYSCIPSRILAGDWKLAACFAFAGRQPVVTGWCSGTDSSGDPHDSGLADEVEDELADEDEKEEE